VLKPPSSYGGGCALRSGATLIETTAKGIEGRRLLKKCARAPKEGCTISSCWARADISDMASWFFSLFVVLFYLLLSASWSYEPKKAVHLVAGSFGWATEPEFWERKAYVPSAEIVVNYECVDLLLLEESTECRFCRLMALCRFCFPHAVLLSGLLWQNLVP
jgi:hypothetical protein